MQEHHPCRLCGKPGTQPALSLPNSPRNIQNLLRAEDLARDRAIDLQVRQCTRCGFVQLPPVLDDDYYDDYLMRANHSPQMESHQQQQASGFIHRFGLTGKRVIEVGCGEGSGMKHLQAAGAVVFGVEPSRRLREIAVASGLPVEGCYVTAEGRLAHGPFDAFVSRQVLEHVPDIHDFLTGVHRNLIPGAVGLIEVPSLEKALLDHRYYDFFSDHVNYFSLNTLALAVAMNGFEVLDSYHAMFDEYNVVLVKAVEPPNLNDIQTTSAALAEELRQFVADYHAAGKKVAVWGAGGKGLSVLASDALKDIDLLVDSDTYKQGLYTPVSHHFVNPPSAEKLQGMDAVIVTAMAYRAEIESELRQRYGFAGTIAFLGHHLVVT
jgi:SAM-dependent methyltransferase